jgi:Tol biopolymer transport system component
MAAALLPNALWELIEPLLPLPRSRPNGGRPRVSDRACLTGILRAAQRNTMADVASRTGLWFWHDMLATPARLGKLHKQKESGTDALRAPELALPRRRHRHEAFLFVRCGMPWKKLDAQLGGGAFLPLPRATSSLESVATMPLTAGAQFGPYEILAAIGAGGMGEVYRARDTKLNRDIALKVLPEAFTTDPDRLARFKREAQVLASLNHANIAHIHGFEDAGPTSALVMELVDGPTLAELIQRRRGLPPDEVLPIARQIAEALETAHELGIVHRDLKPANVKVCDDGTVKVLDFGLAKALIPENAASSVDAMNSPTLTAQATQFGIILGTAAYMSPEQAKGKHVDRRADIWAFGVVLYEMLTGRRGYEAEDVSDTLAAVLTRDVDWKALPPDVPPRLLALLRDCLVRDPKQRLRDIGDARRVLDQIMAGVPDPVVGVGSAQSKTRLSGAGALPWGVAAVALTGAATLTFVHFRETPPTQQRVRFQVSAPEQSSIGAFALSPDGRHLVFSTGGSFGGVQGGTSKLWLRPIDSLETRAVTGTEGTAIQQDQLFWSPDSEYIGFVTQDGRLKKVSVNGGSPQTLVSGVTPITRGAWGIDGTILLVRGANAPIQRVPDVGGPVVDVTKKIDGWSRFQPHFLPDGRHFLYYVIGGSSEVSGIYVTSLEDDAQAKRLLPDSTATEYVPSEVPGRRGYLLFVRETTLMAQPFDAHTVTLTGQMFPVAESVGRFSVSQNGALAYMAGGTPFLRQELVWVDRSGRQLGVAAAPAKYRNVRLSPDEKSITFDQTEEANTDVWVLDLVRGVPSRITFDPAQDNLPIWSADGRRILWPSRRSGALDLFIKAASGTGQDEKLITMGTVNGWGTDWSRDGKFVLYQRPGDKTGQDLWIAPQSTGASGEPQKPFPYLDSPFNEANGVFSPDGRWIAYESDESGRPEVYVQGLPLTNQKVRISTGGGTDAAWSKNGVELFYLAADRNLMAVPYRATVTTFEPGAGKVLFPVPGNVVRRSYAVSGDGRRLLIGKPVDENTSEPITVVLNWLDELKGRVPSKQKGAHR